MARIFIRNVFAFLQQNGNARTELTECGDLFLVLFFLYPKKSNRSCFVTMKQEDRSTYELLNAKLKKKNLYRINLAGCCARAERNDCGS